ncbi:MAG TPA: (2Fe-2S) ferredoxin domain-containing protein [Rhodospirillaceae bacterium]|nr:(2Fe-2S) ferredoxin domain-containing protein [Rhodospirillaceae bacterium]
MSKLSGDPAPFFRMHLFVCTNRRPNDHPFGSCAARNGEQIRDWLKAKAAQAGLKGDVCVTKSGCLSRCDQGPVVVVYPEGIWYSPKTEQDVEEIVSTHLIKGGRVPRLMLR